MVVLFPQWLSGLSIFCHTCCLWNWGCWVHPCAFCGGELALVGLAVFLMTSKVSWVE